MGGELVTETFGFDGGRQVTVFVPPDPTDSVVFSGDGQSTGRWAAVLEAAGRTSTMLVGVHRHVDEAARLHEYSPDFDPDRFAAHEHFLISDVHRWTSSRFGVAFSTARTAVFGVSAGGEFALALGLRRPDLFGSILCASPGGGYQPPPTQPGLVPPTYLVAGNGEPFFLANATRWATALRDAGGEVVLRERDGGHCDAFWDREFPLMVEWAFGNEPTPSGAT